MVLNYKRTRLIRDAKHCLYQMKLMYWCMYSISKVFFAYKCIMHEERWEVLVTLLQNLPSAGSDHEYTALIYPT